MRFLTSILTIVALTLIMLAHPRVLNAHPHAWIDLDTRAVVDSEGRLTAIEQTWLFGDFYSSFVLSEIDTTDRESVIDYLRSVARENLISLREYDYFTVIRLDGVDQAIADVETFETGVIEGRIYMKITTALETPVSVTAGDLRYAVYDPTYYVEILHTKGRGPTVGAAGVDACQTQLHPPAPTMEQIAFASSLEQEATAPGGLGEIFAEWTAVTCR